MDYEELKKAIMEKIYDHENGLSDGFGYYNGHLAVECLADDIVNIIKDKNNER